MWISPDGRVDTIAIPTASLQQCAELVAAIRNLTAAEADLVQQRIEAIEWATAEAMDSLQYSAAERQYENEILPGDLLTELPWSTLIDADAPLKFKQIDLRWRIDVVSVILQILADRDEGEKAAGGDA